MSRLLAGALDLLVLASMLAALYAAWAGLLFLWRPERFSFPDVPLGALFVVGGLVLTAYLTVSWTTTGRTYGDHVLGLRVVTARGRRLGATRALARAVLCVAFPIGLLWSAVSPANRSLQDVLLRTTVVYDWVEHPGPSARGA